MTPGIPRNETDSEELSLLVQHYETSFAITQGREPVRNRMLWIIVSLSVALTLLVFTDIFAVSQPPRGGVMWMAYSLLLMATQKRRKVANTRYGG